MKKSVIVSTYNRPRALELVLSALADQEDRDYEVLVADDGSGDATREAVREFQKKFPVRLAHVWQQDLGFRLARIRNLAAKEARGEYLVFLDGDCVPPKDWLARHGRLAERNRAVSGNRVLVSETFTKEVEDSGLRLQDLTLPEGIALLHKGRINRVAPLLRLSLPCVRAVGGRRWQRLRGCNFSMWKDDFARVNGCDEVFEGWGFEDSDLAIRLINAGLRIKSGSFATGVFHLYHKQSDRGSKESNRQRMLERIGSGLVRAEKGFDNSPAQPGDTCDENWQAA